MRRSIFILLFSTILFTQTELHELLRLPILIEHYFEHKAENKGISFLGFLSYHYTNDDPKDKDHERDMQLPFKSTDCEQMATSLLIVPPAVGFSFTIPEAKHYSYPRFQESLPRHLSLKNIWQPPKAA